MKPFAIVLSLLLGVASSADDRPNILLIVADDLGYADIGAWGSDISTPNIDSIARRGQSFTRFHTAPMCGPTRAMLMSGNNNHVAGVGRQYASGPVQDHLPGYEDRLSDRIVPFPRLLQAAGYRTVMAGKWHLGHHVDHGPVAAGFDRAYSLLHGAANHYDERGYTEKGSVYAENGEFVDYPVGTYSTTLYTDKLISYLEETRESGKPFFAYAAYTSPHWPLQAPAEDIAKYAGRYADGYEALRIDNFERLTRAGVIRGNHALPPRNPGITPWEDLTAEEQKVEAKKMQLYAAMVDNLDQHIGQLFDYLRRTNDIDNTIIIFMGDNGAAAEDFFESDRTPYKAYVQATYNNDYDQMGSPKSFVSYGPQWAEAGSAPFSRHKTHMTSGGVIAPLLVAGPGIAGTGYQRMFVTVMDLAPTLLELAGASYPDTGFEPMRGRSLLPLWSGNAARVHDDDDVFVLSHRNRAMLRQGAWKIANRDVPFSESHFMLFNVEDDPGEGVDLSEKYPEKRDALIELWRAHRRELGIVLPQDL